MDSVWQEILNWKMFLGSVCFLENIFQKNVFRVFRCLFGLWKIVFRKMLSLLVWLLGKCFRNFLCVFDVEENKIFSRGGKFYFENLFQIKHFLTIFQSFFSWQQTNEEIFFRKSFSEKTVSGNFFFQNLVIFWQTNRAIGGYAATPKISIHAGRRKKLEQSLLQLNLFKVIVSRPEKILL